MAWSRPGDDSPEIVNAYIEIVPTDAVKYELDKASGHLRIDRPQRFSSLCPTLYGFIPQTFCGEQVGELCAERTGRNQHLWRPGSDGYLRPNGKNFFPRQFLLARETLSEDYE